MQFPGEGGMIAELLLLLYFKRGKHKGASHFTILNLQLSISRVQFCSSKGYLLRSIMHAAVVVILKQNRQKRRFHSGILEGVSGKARQKNRKAHLSP